MLRYRQLLSFKRRDAELDLHSVTVVATWNSQADGFACSVLPMSRAYQTPQLVGRYVCTESPKQLEVAQKLITHSVWRVNCIVVVAMSFHLIMLTHLSPPPSTPIMGPFGPTRETRVSATVLQALLQRNKKKLPRESNQFLADQFHPVEP